MDVQSDFLNCILSEEVYVKQPKGFEDPKFCWEERRVETMTLFLFAWWKTKVIEILTLWGIYRDPK